ncbi:MAG: hypothetical protein AB8H80_06760 [Planctomycetota bacterium]
MRTIRYVGCGILLAAALPAQITLSSGNLGFTTADPSATSQLPRSMDLVADALQVDQGFEHWWYFRVAGDTMETALRDVGGLASSVSASGEHGDRDFADVDGRGLLKASLDFDAFSAGPASGLVISRLTVMNTSPSALTVDLFAYTDVDVAGSAGDDSCIGSGDSHLISDASGVQIEVRGVGADGSDVLAYPALRNQLSDTAVDDLSNALPPFAGDYTGAFQWQRTLQPFEQRTFTVLIAVDTPAIAPPAVEHYGAGNGSQFEIFADEMPLQDLVQPRSFGVRMKGALPGAEYRIVTGLDSWTPLPFIPGIELWVNPPSIIGVYGGLTDANGEAAEVFGLPTTAYLTGISVYHQCFYVDAAAPNGFAFSTPGMRTTVGKL